MYFYTQKCKQTHCFEKLEVLWHRAIYVGMRFVEPVPSPYFSLSMNMEQRSWYKPYRINHFTTFIHKFFLLQVTILYYVNKYIQVFLIMMSWPSSPCCFLRVCRFGGPSVVNSTSEIATIMLTKITARFRCVSRLFLFLMTMST